MTLGASSRPGASHPARAAPWSDAPAAVLHALQTTPARGLSDAEARRRLRRYGPNRLREIRRRSTWRILVDQFTSPIVALLAGAAALAYAFDEQIEGLAVLAVLLINAAVGFVTERRAVRSMEALRELGDRRTTVRRAGAVSAVPATQLVPGDIVVLDAGDVLTADVRLVAGSRLQADESALTGESVAVDKDPRPVPVEAPLGERTSMLYKGTAVTRGAGEAVVVATGMATELGRISSLLEAAEPETTPLERRLERLARRLIGLTIAVAVLVGAGVVATGRGLYFAAEIGIALAVATIPEGLPIVATVALARGMWRMLRRNALVEQLAAVETLGSTTVILTDKTGTLTENRMTAVELCLARGRVRITGSGLETRGDFRMGEEAVALGDCPELLDALRAGVLCNNAVLELDPDRGWRTSGDPTEVALLVAGGKAGLHRGELLGEWPEVQELAFDPETKRMATVHRRHDRLVAAVKGAPETVLEACSAVRTRDGAAALAEEERARWLALAETMAGTGERVLALASAELGPDQARVAFAFRGLTLLGLVGLIDPPRPQVRAAIEACQAAGIRVAMVTGDHGATAWTVAGAVGLIDPAPGAPACFVDARTLPPFDTLSLSAARALLAAPVIARATPKQKLDLIGLHQRSGAVVAMTGDGVNDAPALKKADIGIAMGLRGTQVAREAADMVLRDDELGTIVAAVAQGRAIFANIRKFVIYLMSCNVSEILAVALGTLFPGPLPILPLQILFLNLVTDVFPALALGVCEGSPALMRQHPRDPREPVLTRRHWRDVFGLGAVIATSVIAALGLAVLWLEKPEAEATTIAFLTLAMAQLWHVFSMRNPGSGWVRNEVTGNRWVWAALVLCVLLLLLAVYWSPLARTLAVADPGLSGWAVALGASLAPLVVGQLALVPRSRRSRSPPVEARGLPGSGDDL